MRILNAHEIDIASEAIKKGELVAFPTETVYGLGGDALNISAIQKIFEVKGRPIDNPLIVHINSLDMLEHVVYITEDAELLIERFWPGPLTLILKKKDIVPGITCANLDTIAVRMPNHDIALKLIKKAGVPIAAPSANLSGKPSPTSISHVMEDLNDKINYAIDGKVNIGVESTVVDLTEEKPLILRHGGITFEELKEIVDIEIFTTRDMKKVKSPGMKYRHYAPNTPLVLATGKLNDMVFKINKLIEEYNKIGENVGIIATHETIHRYPNNIKKRSIGTRDNLYQVSKNLFNILREMDKENLDVIIIESFEKKGLGFAIMERLEKASVSMI